MRSAHPVAVSASPVWQMRLLDAADEARAAGEHFVARRFARCHGARVSHFMPWLLTMQGERRIGAVLGIRSAAAPLFLEHYLDQPVEQLVSARFHRPVARDGIVEIGNLAAARAGARYCLFVALVGLLHQAGFRWLVFTGTGPVRRALETMRLPVRPLGPADPDRLGEQAASWGDYYRENPWVLTGDLEAGMAAIAADPGMAAALRLFRESIEDAACRLA